MKIKEKFRNILISKPLNRRLIRPLRNIKFIFPFHYLSRIPIIGEFSFTNGDSKLIKFTSNGYDPTANLLHWSNGKNYEPNIINLLHKLGAEAQVLFDVGANTGIISIEMALLPAAKAVYAFEPLSRAFEALKKNLEINNLSNCFAHQIALGDSNKTSKLYVPNVEAIPTSASLSPDFYPDHTEIEVEITTLDNFVEKNNIKCLDIVKIDVEGCELAVLGGMETTIRKFRPLIICEILPRTGDLKKVYKLLQIHGYYMYEILDHCINPIEDINKYQRNRCIDLLLSPIQQVDLNT